MPISIEQFWTGIFTVAAVQGLLIWFLKFKIEEYIKHTYSKKLEDYKFSQLQRQKAELVAEFFSKWIMYRGNEAKLLTNVEMIEHYRQLTRMSLELSIWIKDVELLNEIMGLFSNSNNTSDIRALVGKVRKLILEDEDDRFEPYRIVTWPSYTMNEILFGTAVTNENMPNKS